MMAPVQQQPGVWWSNDTHFVWCGKSNCLANLAGSEENAYVVKALADEKSITFDAGWLNSLWLIYTVFFLKLISQLLNLLYNEKRASFDVIWQG